MATWWAQESVETSPQPNRKRKERTSLVAKHKATHTQCWWMEDLGWRACSMEGNRLAQTRDAIWTLSRVWHRQEATTIKRWRSQLEKSSWTRSGQVNWSRSTWSMIVPKAHKIGQIRWVQGRSRTKRVWGDSSWVWWLSLTMTSFDRPKMCNRHIRCRARSHHLHLRRANSYRLMT